MKTKNILIVLVLLGVAAGIGGWVFMHMPAVHKVESSKLSEAFPAGDALQAEGAAAAASIKAGKYADALASITKLVDSGKLTDAQKQAITDVLVDLQVVISGKTPPLTDAEDLFNTISELNNKLM